MATIDRRGVSVDATDTAIAGDPNPGLAIKTACRVATTANITLAGLQTIDGVALADGDRVLVWHQTASTQNGIYTASTGNWSRSADANSNDQWASGLQVVVTAGTTQARNEYQCTTADPIILGTSNISFQAAGSTSGVPTTRLINTTAPLTGGGALASDLTLSTQIAATSLAGNPTASANVISSIVLGATLAFSGSSLQTASGTGDVTWPANSSHTTLVNIPNATPMAGSLLATNIAAPGTPAAGKSYVYVDSTQKVLSNRNDAGVVSVTVVPSTAPSNQFATSVNSAGIVGYSQPTASGISGGFALTASNDTNVTLALGGTPNSSLLAGVTLTAGWTGTLAAGRLNANVVQAITPDTNISGSIATQTLTFSWAGQLSVARGGTGVSSLTAYNLLVGSGTSNVALIAPNSSTGIPLVSQGSSANPAYSLAVVPGGGTGVSSLTPYAVMCGGSTATGSVAQVGSLGSSGQVLTSQGASALPAWTTVGGTGTVTQVSSGWGIALSPSPLTSSGSVAVATTNPPYGFDSPVNLQLNASVASGVLTIAVKGNNGNDPSAGNPVLLPFRDSAITSGAVNWRALTSALSISSWSTSATFGAVNSVPFRIWVTAFDNAGTPVLAFYQSVTGGSSPTGVGALNPCALASTTATSSGSTSAATFYTPNGTTLSSKPYCILGYVEYVSGLVTAGSFTTPSAIQLYGPSVRLPNTPIQRVVHRNGAQLSTTSSTFVDTNVTLSITPTSAINIIFLNYSGTVDTQAGSNHAYTQLHRSGTAIGMATDFYAGAGSETLATTGTNVLDSPQTTTAQTYTVRLKSGNGTNTVYFPLGSISYLEAQEISV